MNVTVQFTLNGKPQRASAEARRGLPLRVNWTVTFIIHSFASDFSLVMTPLSRPL